MTDPLAPPPAPPPPLAPAPAAAPAVPTTRSLPWWGWLLLGLGILGIVLTAVFTAQAMGALVGGAPNPAPVGAGPGDEPAAEPSATGFVYVSDDFPFEVTFPGEPSREVIGQAVVGYDLELITVTWSGGGRSVILGSTEFPSELLPGGATDEVLQGSLDGAAGNVAGTVVDQEFITVDGERAITGTVTAAGSTFYVTVFFADSVQYSLISENGTSAEHDAYVDSFRFTS